MTNFPEKKGNSKEFDPGTDRRDFIKGAAAASLLGALGMASAVGESVVEAQATVAAGSPQASTGPRPGARLDCRFPASFSTSVPTSMNIMTQYFQALVERKLDGMAQTLHFPFVTYEGAEAVVIDSADKLMASPPLSMNVTGKGTSMIKPGAFDVMDHIQLHMYGPNGAGLSLEYSRFDAHGNKMLACHGLYGITNNDGKWGIEYMSTIFKPMDQIGRDDAYNIPAVDSAYHANQRDHVAGRRDSDLDQLHKAVGDPFPYAAVNIGAPAAGTKSRLRVSSGDTPEYLAKQTYNQATFATTSGEGIDRWYTTIETPDARVLYASMDKGHVYAGFTRYTSDGTIISTVRYLIAQVYKKGNWYGNDLVTTFGTANYYDHLNDVLT
jgi:hypothetical protein